MAQGSFGFQDPRNAMGMGGTPLPEPPAPDIGAAVMEFLSQLLRGPGPALFGDPLAGVDPEQRRYLEMTTGGMPMGLMGKGQVATTMGPDVLDAIRNFIRTMSGSTRPVFPQLRFPERMQLKQVVEDSAASMAVTPKNTRLTPDEYESVMAMLTKLPLRYQQSIIQSGINNPDKIGNLPGEAIATILDSFPVRLHPAQQSSDFLPFVRRDVMTHGYGERTPLRIFNELLRRPNE